MKPKKQPPGRPKIIQNPTFLGVNLTGDLAGRLDDYAKNAGVGRSEAVRRLLAEALPSAARSGLRRIRAQGTA